jgi:hypothetical protein
MTLAVSIAQGGANNVTMRNRIINGGMMIDQRNAGASVTPTVDGTYTLDRWATRLSAASKYSVQQSTTAPANYKNSLAITSLAATSLGAGDYYALSQAIEGFNIADLGWGTATAAAVTLSFWVRSSLTGTFGGCMQNSANNRSYPFTYTISSANTWEQKSITVLGDTSGSWSTNNSTGILLFFGLGVGANYSGTAGAWAGANYLTATGATSVVGTNGATFYITGVQLEAGTTATAFEQRLYGTELALCQRYFEVLYSDNAGECIFSAQWSTGYRWVWQMKVPKRTNASFALVGSGNWQVNTPSVNSGITNIGAYSATGIYYLQGTANTVVGSASAEL